MNDWTHEQNNILISTATHRTIQAPPGAGKTALITELIKRDNDQGLRILGITFTNNAAEELLSRCGGLSNGSTITTLHSLAWKLIQMYSDVKYTIITPYWQTKLLNELFPDADAIKEIAKHINNLQLKTGSKCYSDDKVCKQYYQECQTRGYIDFNGLIIEAVKYVQENMFQTVYGDEWQDFDENQFDLFSLIVEKSEDCRSTIVGDIRQQIYAWRGAMKWSFRQYTKRFDSVEYFLTNNFRSDNFIIDIANKVTLHQHLPYMVNTSGKQGECNIVQYNTQAEETKRMVGVMVYFGVKRKAQCAALFRTKNMMRKFEAELIKYNTPYTIWGNKSILDYAEIKMILSWLNLLVDSEDSMFFQAAAMTLSGIGIKTAQGKSLSDCYQLTVETDRAFSKTEIKLIGVYNIYDSLAETWEADGIPKLVDAIVKTIPYTFDDDKILQFLQIIEEYETLEEFCQNVSLKSNIELSEEPPLLILATIHAVKGMEFDTVLLPYCNNGVYPIKNCDNVEEEGNILFTGLSRAIHNLFFSYSRQADVSPFLSEVIQQKNSM